MSELQLSNKLVEDLRSVITQHDDTAQDPGVVSQYLCAVVGYLLGQQDMPAQQKSQVIEELGAFIQHVADDVAQQSQQQAPPPPPPAAAAQNAFGIWKPKP